jgi:hypothetical protein
MSLPTSRQDLVGNLVLSGSSDLNLPVGVNISTGTAATSNEITIPNPGTNIALVQMPCGSTLVQMSIYSTSGSPDFASPTATLTTSTTASVKNYLVGDSSSTNKYLKLRITNNSGVSLAPTQLVLLCLNRILSPEDLLSGVMANAGGVVNSTHYGPDGSSGTGTFGLTSGN